MKVVGNSPKQIMAKTARESVEYWPSYGPSKFPGLIWPKNLEKFHKFGGGLRHPWSPTGPVPLGEKSPKLTPAKKKIFFPVCPETNYGLGPGTLGHPVSEIAFSVGTVPP